MNQTWDKRNKGKGLAAKMPKTAFVGNARHHVCLGKRAGIGFAGHGF